MSGHAVAFLNRKGATRFASVREEAIDGAAEGRVGSPVFGYPVNTQPCVWQASWLISFATSACSTESGMGAPVFRLDLMVRDTASPTSTAFWRTSWKWMAMAPYFRARLLA